MLGVSRSTELATSLMHLGGLSGAGTRLAADDPWGALGISLIACLCVVLLTGAFVLTEVARVEMQGWVRRHQEMPSEPPAKREDEDASR